MRHILLLATALAVLGGAASAEANQASGTSATSSSRAVASTMSSARSAAVGNVGNSTTINVSGDGSTGTTDPSQYIGYGGGYTLRNTPEVIPPNVVGGNPCAIGASAGLSMAGFGIAGGATWADKQCERRQQAALLFNIGKAKAATELLCQDDNVRAALRLSGEPCVADSPPVAAAAMAPVGAIAPPAGPARPIRPEWCYTAGPAELRHHAECQIGS